MKSQNSLLSIHTASVLTNNNNNHTDPQDCIRRKASVEGPIPVQVFRGNALEKVFLLLFQSSHMIGFLVT